MSVISFILIAIAFGISIMLLMHRCTGLAPIHLSAGLLVSFVFAVIHAAMFCLGIRLGNLLRFELPDNADAFSQANSLVFLGLGAFIAIRMLLPYMGKKTTPASYDLNTGFFRVLLFALGASINGFLFGVGAGFITSLMGHFHGIFWPLFVSTLLFSYLGIMYGRQHVKLRPRRWMAISSILLLGVIIAAVVNN